MIRNPLLLLASALLSLPTWAQEAAAVPAPAAPDPVKGLLLNIPIFLALFLLFYFGLISPQKNQQKKHQDFLSKLNKGDEIVTVSGIIGKIQGLTEKVVTLEISPDTEIKILRSQVQGYLKDSVSN